MISNLRILFVEDEQILRETLGAYFDVYNTLRTAANLTEARSFLRSEPAFDLVLLDKGLPDGNGIELIADVRATSPNAAIVVLTGDDDFHAVATCLKAGADDYVVKSARLVQDLLVRIPVAVASVRARSRQVELRASPSCRLPLDRSILTPSHFSNYRKKAERDYLLKALEICEWDTITASRKLGIGRSTLFKKMQELSIERVRGENA